MRGPQTGIAPDFTLVDARTGEPLTLFVHAGERDALLLFFRGTWCPFCREQMRLLSEGFPRLLAAGIVAVGVVCESESSLRRYAQGQNLPFPLLADEKREAAKAYGVHSLLAWDGFNLAKPSLFVLNRERRITFAHRGQNMTDLPVTAVLQRFLEFLPAEAV